MFKGRYITPSAEPSSWFSSSSVTRPVSLIVQTVEERKQKKKDATETGMADRKPSYRDVFTLAEKIKHHTWYHQDGQKKYGGGLHVCQISVVWKCDCWWRRRASIYHKFASVDHKQPPSSLTTKIPPIKCFVSFQSYFPFREKWLTSNYRW